MSGECLRVNTPADTCSFVMRPYASVCGGRVFRKGLFMEWLKTETTPRPLSKLNSSSRIHSGNVLYNKKIKSGKNCESRYKLKGGKTYAGMRLPAKRNKHKKMTATTTRTPVDSAYLQCLPGLNSSGWSATGTGSDLSPKMFTGDVDQRYSSNACVKSRAQPYFLRIYISKEAIPGKGFSIDYRCFFKDDQAESIPVGRNNTVIWMLLIPNRSKGMTTAWSFVRPGGNATETGISPEITPSPAHRRHS